MIKKIPRSLFLSGMISPHFPPKSPKGKKEKTTTRVIVSHSTPKQHHKPSVKKNCTVSIYLSILLYQATNIDTKKENQYKKNPTQRFLFFSFQKKKEPWYYTIQYHTHQVYIIRSVCINSPIIITLYALLGCHGGGYDHHIKASFFFFGFLFCK